MPRGVTAVLLLAGILVITGCSDRESADGTALPTITLATTTSTQDSGLLDMLIPRFRKQTGIDVRVVAVGSGQALELGRRGDADVLLTHSPSDEATLVQDGFAEARVPVFYNDFVLVGPSAGALDEPWPATLDAVLRQIASQNRSFVSRGDDSGTHRREQQLWQSVLIEPRFSGYLNAGSGMAQTLRIAAEKQACTLIDRGTWLVHRSETDLQIIVEGDPRLINPYAVLVVNPRRHPHVHAPAARQFAAFLQEPGTQTAVGEFGRERFGQSLFFPGDASGEGQRRSAF